MWKAYLILGLCAALIINVECDFSLKGIFQRKTTTTSTTTEAPTTPKAESLYTSYNVPKPAPGCIVHFACKKKLKQAAAPKPCLKYCVHKIECPNNVETRGEPDQCIELNEQLVLTEATAIEKPTSEGTSNVHTMPVAMIDFPCQPGYLPDSRGRCREVW